jgi:hypothetical protein
MIGWPTLKTPSDLSGLAGIYRTGGRDRRRYRAYVASALAIASEIFSHCLVSLSNWRRPDAVSL